MVASGSGVWFCATSQGASRWSFGIFAISSQSPRNETLRGQRADCASVMKALYECKTRYPSVAIAVEVEVTNSALLLAWLRTGRIDACLLSAPVEDQNGLIIEPMVDEDCVIVLPRNHALANSQSIPLTRLAKEKFILFHRSFSPAMYDSTLGACRRAGFSPNVGHEVGQIVSAIPVVAAGFGVSIVPRSLSAIKLRRSQLCRY